MKKINRPLTDIYGRDFSTGKVVKNNLLSKDFINHYKKTKEEFKKKKVLNNKIYVEGLGFVDN